MFSTRQRSDLLAVTRTGRVALTRVKSSKKKGCPCAESKRTAEILRRLGIPFAAGMHAEKVGSWSPKDWYLHVREEDEKLFTKLRKFAETLSAEERTSLIAEVDALEDEHKRLVYPAVANGVLPNEFAMLSHGAREDALIQRYGNRLLVADGKDPVIRVGVTEADVEADKAAALAFAKDVQTDAEGLRKQIKGYSDEADKIRKLGESYMPSTASAAERAKAESDLSAALKVAQSDANARDNEGYKEVNAKLGEVSKYAGSLVLIPGGAPVAAVAVAMVALAAGIAAGLKAIGLNRLRVGRARGAFDDEWIEQASEIGQKLTEQGVPYSFYNEGQHVTPREYVSYLQEHYLKQIGALDTDRKQQFDEATYAFAYWVKNDPVVALLYANIVSRPMSWIYYTNKTDEPSSLTYPHMGASGSEMVELIAMTSMRENNVSPSFFNDIERAAAVGWNDGLDQWRRENPKQVPYGGGGGAAALSYAWRAAQTEALRHAGTGPRVQFLFASTNDKKKREEERAKTKRISNLWPIVLGSLTGGVMFLAGASKLLSAIPAAAGAAATIFRSSSKSDVGKKASYPKSLPPVTPVKDYSGYTVSPGFRLPSVMGTTL